MSYMKGDAVFPPGYSPRCCAICGLKGRGMGFKSGFARSSHGRKHVREGTAREIIRWNDYDYVITDAGADAANALHGKARCDWCGLADGKHARSCPEQIKKQAARIRGAR